MKKFLVLFFSFCVISQIFAKETLIQGVVSGFEGKFIRLTTIEDYITQSEQKLAVSKINDGRFSFNIQIEEVQQIIISIEDKSTTFYVENGAVYNIGLSYSDELNRGKIYDKVLSLNFSFPQKEDINQILRSFNDDYSNFFEKNAVYIAQGSAVEEINQFCNKVASNSYYNQNEFVKTYVTYSCASLKDAANFGKKELKTNYLQSKPIAYANKEYIFFFQQYYANNFKKMVIGSKGAELLKEMTIKYDLDKTLNLIEKNIAIENRAYAELFLMNGLYAVFFDQIVNKESSKKILGMLSTKASNQENRIIAKNILEKLSYYGKEADAPNFKMYNQKDELVQLKDFKGKYIYLNFWASWSLPSVKEMQVIKNLNNRLGDKMAFVSINLDDDKAIFLRLSKQYGYNWTNLHYGNDYEVKEKYQIKTVPTYLLINPEGKIENNMAPSPQDAGDYLFNLFK